MSRLIFRIETFKSSTSWIFKARVEPARYGFIDNEGLASFSISENFYIPYVLEFPVRFQEKANAAFIW